jgi:hypothetical protein
MSTDSIRSCRQEPEHDEASGRERIEQEEESNLPWLDEAEIIAHEYDEEVPWVEEG